MTRRLLACLISILLIGSLSLGGCLPSDVSSDNAAPDSITVVLGTSGGSLNPYSPMLANRQIGQLLFRGLTDMRPDGTPVPDLLDELPTKANGGISRDGRTIVYTIRPGAKWQDGKPLTAYDVAFTLDLLRGGYITDEPALPYSAVKSVTVADDSRLTVTLSAANAPFVWRMVPYVLPLHLLAQEPRIASASYWFKPVGSGPYRVGAVTPGTSLELLPADGSSVALDIRFAGSAETGEEFYDDTAAAVWLDGPTEAGASGESLVTTASTAWRMWGFNMHEGQPGTDPVVRDAYMSLLAHENTESVPPTDPFGLPLKKRSMSETSSVLARLERAGWRMNDDGIMQKGSRKLELTAAIRTLLSEELPWFEATTSRMETVGIVFKTYALDNLDIGGYFERDYLTLDDWQTARSRFYVGLPHGSAWPFASDDEPSWDNPYGLNVFGVSDERLDALYGRLLSAGSPEEAESRWTELGRRLNELKVIYWEYPEPNNILVKGVDGVAPHTSAEYLLLSAPTWRFSDASTAD